MAFRGGLHRYCDPCQVQVKNERNKELERQKRRQAGMPALGETRSCVLCSGSFSVVNGQQLYCDPCSRERRIETSRDRNKRYRLRHGERLREEERKWREQNPAVKKEREERYKARHPERHKLRYKRHYQNKKNDPMFALNYRMRHGIWRSVKEYKQGQPWEGFVDYTVDELRVHLERQFLPGMGWHNMGQWHIDHIVPLAHHKFESPEDPEFKAAWALTNLRPLWAEENLRKSAKRLVLL
jgi:hypothetical protein